ncbi:folate-binding protein YgfZ [Massilia sp. RP-1-19]|uniref:Folate-binding protein YgfZ n=1 Tax=Massilia polaris TaxID=2728846 RepID=A0A848HQ73_9BURK|nr:folate-binding protein YgfZ [Massilia polaris]NML63502.1 folate-binding protein YgfZ [Massilia polaris]
MNNINSWNDYLASAGAPVLTADELAKGFVAVVNGQDLIAVTGDDAASFLHGQLTNDVEHLGNAEARLAAYCSPKGRMLASFLMWRNAESVFLQVPSELRAALQKRLSMFVLRAKARLSDVSADTANSVTLGIGGANGQAALQQVLGALPAAPYTRIDHALGTVIRLADAFGAPRYQWLSSPETARELLPTLRSTLAFGGSDAWRLSEIHAGIPQITLKTQEQFVPQMVNYELIGGVNFKKGCYPGQEIVARSQYLGKLKRRTALASIDSIDAAAGDEVFDVADPDQPCGMIVNAAPNGVGGVDALVELKLAALEQGEIRLGSASGAPLRFKPMPYALDALDL